MSRKMDSFNETFFKSFPPKILLRCKLSFMGTDVCSHTKVFLTGKSFLKSRGKK